MKKPKQPKIVWSADAENFQYDSLGELIEALRWEYDEVEAGIKVCYGEAVVPSAQDLFCVDYLLDILKEQAYEIAGEHAEEFPGCTIDAKKRLKNYIGRWIDKHCKINFWKVDNVKDYIVTEGDLRRIDAPLLGH